MKKREIAFCIAINLISCISGCSNGVDEGNILFGWAREEGSGTRNAFDELVKNNEGASISQALEYTPMASCIAETSSTAAVITSVARSTTTIGYVSLGIIDKNLQKIKPISINGILPTTKDIMSGDYVLSRPFHLVYQSYETLSNEAKDFIRYIKSENGQKIVLQEGFISIANKVEYFPQNITGTISIDGSTSIQPLMLKLVFAYQQLNPNVKIDVQGGGSGVGITNAGNGTVDIGMVSRNLKKTENNVIAEKIADDGIAIVVNSKCKLKNVSLDELFHFYVNGRGIEI